MDTFRDKNGGRWIIIAGSGGMFGTPDPESVVRYDPVPPDTDVKATRGDVIKEIALYALQHEKEIALTVTANAGGSGWILLAVIAVLVMADSK